jgi:hypothetical protein
MQISLKVIQKLVYFLGFIDSNFLKPIRFNGSLKDWRCVLDSKAYRICDATPRLKWNVLNQIRIELPCQSRCPCLLEFGDTLTESSSYRRTPMLEKNGTRDGEPQWQMEHLHRNIVLETSLVSNSNPNMGYKQI